jgi:hypothetical protein
MDIPPPGVERNPGPHFDQALDQPDWSRGRVGANCPNPKLITGPKSPLIQSISILFDLKDSCCFLRFPDLLQSLAAEIILPTKAPGGYGDHLCNFCQPDDNCRMWQVV